MSGSYFDYLMKHVRLSVLRTLVEAPGNTANDSLLASSIGELGLPVTRDQLRGQLSWLDEQGLIRITRSPQGVMVAALRERGAEVAHGIATVDGVQRPSVAR